MALTGTPQPPPAPNPYQTAAAQTSSNIGTGIANSVMGNPNRVGPYGSTTYSRSGEFETIRGPNGESYEIPRYTETTTLSPEQQRLYDLNTQTQTNIGQIGVDQSARIGDILGKPVDYGDLRLDPNSFSADRQRVEQAMYDRMQPQLDRELASERNRLTNMGFVEGTEAYRGAMDDYNRRINDLRLGITERGLGEQQGLYGMARDAAGFEMQRRTQQQNQPINAITALMSGSQVSMPNTPNYVPGQVAGTDVSGNVYNSAALANQNYQQQMAANNAMWGGISQLGGMGLYALAGPGAMSKKLWG